MQGMGLVRGPARPPRSLGVLLRTFWLPAAVFAAALSLAPPLFAQVVPPTLITCSTQTDSGERLACYDREIARLRQLPPTTSGATMAPPVVATSPTSASPSSRATASTSAPPASTGTTAPASPVPPPGSFAPPDPKDPVAIDRFGLTPDMQHQRQEEGRAPKELPQITAKVTSVRYKARGELVVGLDNGQTWEQAEYDGDVSMSVGETVTIKAGALTAYYMKPRVGRIVRVRRIH
jgi:hypothetical protein